MNQFSDMTQEEFKAQSLGGYKRMPQPEGAAKKSVKVNAQVMPVNLLLKQYLLNSGELFWKPYWCVIFMFLSGPPWVCWLERFWSCIWCQEPGILWILLGLCHHWDDWVLCCYCFWFHGWAFLPTGILDFRQCSFYVYIPRHSTDGTYWVKYW